MKISTARKTVLIIDDEEELCMLMEMVLERKQFQASSIHSLEEALKKIEQLKPDYIFLDNQLPDGLGINYIRKMVAARPQAKIVMMTAYNEKQLTEKALEEGASYFLHKPFNRNTIENIINSL